MQPGQINVQPDLKILVAPLDWGLGHATRCIPIIRYLLQNNCQVTLAAEGAVATLLKDNYPELEIITLQGYHISYSNTAAGFTAKILLQIPKILSAIRSENRWLEKIQKRNNFDLIISDNRYGLKIKGSYSVIMTHQLQIRSGTGKWTDRLLKWLHYRVLEKFDECWVVDNQGTNNLGGSLSHPEKIPTNSKYIGLLSQLNPASRQTNSGSKEILVLLSGPEPMRGILEKKILTQIEELTQYHFNIVAGNPMGSVPDNLPDHVSYHTHMNAEQINGLMQKALLVICRSGYSTLMDLAVMRKNALLIPTPGQTEQEYLADRLLGQGILFYKDQASLHLSADIPRAIDFPGFSEAGNQNDFRSSVDDLLERLRRR